MVRRKEVNMSRKFEATADPVDLTKVYKVIMQGCGHLEERRMLPSTARKPWSPFMVIKSRKGAKCKVCRSGGTVAVWVSKSRNEAPPEKQKPTHWTPPPDPISDQQLLENLLDHLKTDVRLARLEAKTQTNPDMIAHCKGLAENTTETARALWRLMNWYDFKGIGPIPE